MAEVLTLFQYAEAVAAQSTAESLVCDEMRAPEYVRSGYSLYENGRQLAASWKTRALDNLAAIRLAREILEQSRPATADEMDILARYVGFGATELAQSLFPLPGQSPRSGWENVYTSLCELVDERGRSSLARSTQYAHFTPDYLSRAIFDAVVRLGFAGGLAIEPGCGIGLFMAAALDCVAPHIRWTGVEMDTTAAAIARVLQPQATILEQDFTKSRFREPADLVIGNPPFAATHVIGEGPAGRLKLRLHDYFIARSLELLIPGGLAAFITSHGTMDKFDPYARSYMASLADLIGAIRLPQGAMSEQAGTEVVVDVLFFKRTSTPDISAAAIWQDVAETQPASGAGEKPMLVNRYFLEHPEMVLGQHDWTSSPFGPKYTCIESDRNLEDAVLRAINQLPDIAPSGTVPSALTAAPVKNSVRSRTTRAPQATDSALALFTTPDAASARPVLHSSSFLTQAERELDADAYELKEGSFAVAKDKIYQYVDGQLEEVAVKASRSSVGIYPKAARTIRAFVAVRNALRAVITAQVNNNLDANAAAQERLRKTYRAFVSEFGPINLTKTTYTTDPQTGLESSTQRRPNLAPVLDDPDCWLVASIEQYDTETDCAEMGPIFTTQVICARQEPTIHSAADALAAVLDRYGHVDIDAIAQMLNLDRIATIKQLGNEIYALPGSTDTWVTADEYLSGNVRTKLEAARAAAADDPTFQRNVEALEQAQPQDLNPSDVTARLGSPWIPTTDIEAFIKEKLGIETRVHHSIGIATWDLDLDPFRNETSATSEWGTKRRHAGQLLHDALNGAIPQIFDVWKDADGTEHRQLNAVDTEAAREKLTKIHDAFTSWIWTDSDRTLRLMRFYNDTYNNIVPREFDGSHLQLRGTSSAFDLRPNQKRGVWRIVAAGSTYLAHAVGAGKTMTIAAGVMEQRRLGLVNKPILVVPGHCLAQFTVEWLQLYPTAQLLVADEQNFATHKRARFVARATTGNWDCIIITHSAFKLIPSPTQFEKQMIEDEIDSLERLVASVGKDYNKRTSRKRLEQRKEALRMRLEALQGRKDNMVTIAEMGIDQIIVDEAQAFRKLSFVTNAGQIKGIDPEGSQRAWDLYVKKCYIETIRPNRALILASGTPVTNTLGEMFTIQRYMNEDELFSRNIHEFDAWKAMFGETVTELELQPGGQYKPVTRFAQFINVPELVAMFRTYADVVQRKDLRDLIPLPRVAGGGREIITGEATPSFKAYQRYLGDRIRKIEERHGKPQRGDDIILSVISDGRHAAIDVRLVDSTAGNEEGNKLNALVRNVYRIWEETRDNVYTSADGTVSETRGACQMIFSDLGTVAMAAKRGFSVYEWIRDELVRLGVPQREIAFMQDFKKSADKHRLVTAFKRGLVRILIGSTETMGTGVNGQKRLVALHHLDVPWIPSDIEQREGRIERQGNENEEIYIFAYATPGSMDAPMWQTNERKSRFIGMAMSGDRSVRRLDDASSQANSFAIAKAIASGNPLLMQKAGLESEIARLKRLRAAHYDDQHALSNTIASAKDSIRYNEHFFQDLIEAEREYRTTKGDNFAMTVFGHSTRERATAGAYLLGKIHNLPEREHVHVGELAGLDVVGRRRRDFFSGDEVGQYGIQLGSTVKWIDTERKTSPVGIIQRLEHITQDIGKYIAEVRATIERSQRQLTEATARVGREFEHEADLQGKLAQLRAIEQELLAESERIEAERREAEAREKADAQAADAPPSDADDHGESTDIAA